MSLLDDDHTDTSTQISNFHGRSVYVGSGVRFIYK